MADASLQTLFLSDDDVRSAFDWKEAFEAITGAYSTIMDEAMFPPRTMARYDKRWLRALSGVTPSAGVMGVKLISANIKTMNASYLLPLFDLETMELKCLMDANSITGFRTAVTTAIALDAMAPAHAPRLSVVGSGFEAQKHTRALAAVRNFEQISVFSPNPASRQRFIDNLADLGLNIVSAESAEQAVADTDIVICAARSRDETPTFLGEWLRPGMTMASIGSTLEEQREVDVGTIAGSALIVADMPHEVADETGDMIAATEAGVDFSEKLIGLDTLISGAHPGRTDPDQILLYKSVGAAVQDIAVAAMCYERATKLGLGTTMPDTIKPVQKG